MSEYKNSMMATREKEKRENEIINYEIANSFDEAKRQISEIEEYRSLERELSKKLYDGLIPLLENLYDDPERFIYEIMQNADDCRYEKNLEPSVEFVLDNNQMTVKYNEKGFTPQNIMAITGIAESTKNKKTFDYARKFEERQVDGEQNINYTEIGEKGIGFKSLFRACDTVTIKSGFYSFRIEKELPTIPKWENSNKKQIGTSIILRFKEEGYSEKLFKKLKEKYCLKNKMELLNSNLILFLKQIKKVSITKGNEKFTILCKVIENKGTMKKISVSVKKNEECPVEVQCWQYEKIIEFSEYETKSRYGDNRNEKIIHKIIVLAPIDIEEYKEGLLYSFFPTNVTLTAPLIIHAPFRLGTSREGIIYDSNNLWDMRIKDELENPQLWQKIYSGLRDNLENDMDVIKYIPLKNVLKHNILEINIIDVIKTYNILKGANGIYINFNQAYLPEKIFYELFNCDSTAKYCFQNKYELQEKELLDEYYLGYKGKLRHYDLDMLDIEIGFFEEYLKFINIENSNIDENNEIHKFIKNTLYQTNKIKPKLNKLPIFPKVVGDGYSVFSYYKDSDKWFISKSISSGKYNFLDTKFMGNDTFKRLTGICIEELKRETETKVIVQSIEDELKKNNWNEFWLNAKDLWDLWQTEIEKMPQKQILSNYVLPEDLDTDNIFRDMEIVDVLPQLPKDYFGDINRFIIFMNNLGIRKRIEVDSSEFDSVSQKLLESINNYYMSLSVSSYYRIRDPKYIMYCKQVDKLCEEVFKRKHHEFIEACQNKSHIKDMIPVKMNDGYYKMHYDSDNWIWYRFYIECNDISQQKKIIESWGGCVVFIGDKYSSKYLESIGIKHISAVGKYVNEEHFSIERVEILKEILKENEYQEFCLNLFNFWRLKLNDKKMNVDKKNKLNSVILFCASELEKDGLNQIKNTDVNISLSELKLYEVANSINKLIQNKNSKIKINIVEIEKDSEVIKFTKMDEENSYYMNEFTEMVYFNNDYEKIKSITDYAYFANLDDKIDYISTHKFIIINSKYNNLEDIYKVICKFLYERFNISKEKIDKTQKTKFINFDRISIEKKDKNIEKTDFHESIKFFSEKLTTHFKMDNEQVKKIPVEPFSINNKYFIGYSKSCPMCNSKIHTELSGFRIFRRKVSNFRLILLCCQNCKNVLDYAKNIELKINGKEIEEVELNNLVNTGTKLTVTVELENVNGKTELIPYEFNLSVAHSALLIALNKDII